MYPLQPTSAELDSLLRRVRVAVEEERVRVTDYAREGAAALDWNEWDVAEQLRELRVRREINGSTEVDPGPRAQGAKREHAPGM